jgi:hypothetical protein
VRQGMAGHRRRRHTPMTSGNSSGRRWMRSSAMRQRFERAPTHTRCDGFAASRGGGRSGAGDGEGCKGGLERSFRAD